MSQKLEEEDGKRENGLIAEIDPLMSPEKSRMDFYQNHWILHLKRHKDKKTNKNKRYKKRQKDKSQKVNKTKRQHFQWL